MAVAAQRPRLDIETAGIWILLSTAALIAALTIPAFRDPANIANILRQSSVLGILAIGQTFVIVAGMIDLSVGMIAGLVVVLTCWMLDGNALLTLPVAALMLVLSAFVGLTNGVLVNRLNLHPLILTFGMLSVLQGIIFTFTDRSVGRASAPLQKLANGDIWGIPLSAILLVAVLTVASVFFSRTRFGYHLKAVGSNAESARRAGIDVERVVLFSFVISGICAGLAGLLLAGRLGTGYPLAGGGLELDAIVAVVLGGTALAGGRGSAVRSVGGVIALTIISNVLNLLEVSAFVQMFIKGLIVVVAIIVNQPRGEKA
jgi:ribose/xylose/arabinose/galactoside ABC-type transport system permease subunit